MISGNFFRNGDFLFPAHELIDYAVGAPNVINKEGVLTGVVYLCPNCFHEQEETFSMPPDFNLILHGYQHGEKFGQSVISIDIDGDNYDDIVVGAPLHAKEEVSRVIRMYSGIYCYNVINGTILMAITYFCVSEI